MTSATPIPQDAWRKSSFSDSNGGDCVEVADGFPSAVPVRDSKNPHPTLTVRADAWQAFIEHVKA
jgi:uncharacterized protein DUF397